MKSAIISILFTSFGLLSCVQNKISTKHSIELINSEPYELANIVLALTQYGKDDPWEVRKDFDYYIKVQDYFNESKNHPLLDSVNYSRKRWKEYLSFRTDAYAFDFNDSNQLDRRINFLANEGVQPFDHHLDLINDFIKKTNFRTFYRNNLSYYNSIKAKYQQTQLISEMEQFMISEFGNQDVSKKNYQIVLSPLVYRMNCHREIDSTTTADFITIPKYILSDTMNISDYELAVSLHSLFSEMDHGYVNPVTSRYTIDKNFKNEIWDNKSGYGEYKNGVFNEYMTWAIYDIFLQKYFPKLADEVGLYYCYQNESRGFHYSYLFTQKLRELYAKKRKKMNLAKLYPEILNWSESIQNSLSKPEIHFPKDSIEIEFSHKTKIKLEFSEPMEKSSLLDTKFQDGKNYAEIITLTKEKNNLKWDSDGKSVSFELNIPSTRDMYYLQFNWWGMKNALISQKGVLLESGKYFMLKKK
jgi:hypothetical protein